MKIPPVTVGEILKLGVTRFGKNGDPLMFHKDFAIFLQNTGKGGVELNQLVEIKIIKVLPKCAFAVLAKRTHDALKEDDVLLGETE